MRLTAYTDYGLRVLLRLAEQPDSLITSEQIADEHQISRNHLLKVVKGLAEGGFVSTQRGGRGGMQLSRAAHNIQLGDVVRHLEARHALVECFRDDGGDCYLNPGCRLKVRLRHAEEAFLASLNKSTLADCVAAKRLADHGPAAAARSPSTKKR